MRLIVIMRLFNWALHYIVIKTVSVIMRHIVISRFVITRVHCIAMSCILILTTISAQWQVISRVTVYNVHCIFNFCLFRGSLVYQKKWRLNFALLKISTPVERTLHRWWWVSPGGHFHSLFIIFAFCWLIKMKKMEKNEQRRKKVTF